MLFHKGLTAHNSHAMSVLALSPSYISSIYMPKPTVFLSNVPSYHVPAQVFNTERISNVTSIHYTVEKCPVLGGSTARSRRVSIRKQTGRGCPGWTTSRDTRGNHMRRYTSWDKSYLETKPRSFHHILSRKTEMKQLFTMKNDSDSRNGMGFFPLGLKVASARRIGFL